jgi:hypothetical protein
MPPFGMYAIMAQAVPFPRYRRILAHSPRWRIHHKTTYAPPALEREATTLVFKDVPAEVCANCGEAYVAEEVSRQILAAAEHAARLGVQVDVREFRNRPVNPSPPIGWPPDRLPPIGWLDLALDGA